MKPQFKGSLEMNFAYDMDDYMDEIIMDHVTFQVGITLNYLENHRHYFFHLTNNLLGGKIEE